jgi:hypothetical protein
MLTGSRYIGGPFFLSSTKFSALLIISLFAGLYCLAWPITFYRTVRLAQDSS